MDAIFLPPPNIMIDLITHDLILRDGKKPRVVIPVPEIDKMFEK